MNACYDKHMYNHAFVIRLQFYGDKIFYHYSYLKIR